MNSRRCSTPHRKLDLRLAVDSIIPYLSCLRHEPAWQIRTASPTAAPSPARYRISCRATEDFPLSQHNYSLGNEASRQSLVDGGNSLASGHLRAESPAREHAAVCASAPVGLKQEAEELAWAHGIRSSRTPACSPVTCKVGSQAQPLGQTSPWTASGNLRIIRNGSDAVPLLRRRNEKSTRESHAGRGCRSRPLDRPQTATR